MASEDGDGSETGRAPGGRRRRPPVTIEGTASEVAREPVTQSAPEPAPATTSEPATAPEHATTPEHAAEPEPQPAPVAATGADDAPPGEDRAPPEAEAAPPADGEPPREHPPAGRLSSGGSRPLIAGGVAGLAAALAMVAALWGFGAFAPRGEGSAALAGRIDALDTRVRGLAARPAGAADAKGLDDLRARVDAVDANLRRLDDRLAHTESELTTPRSAAADPAAIERLDAVESTQRALNAAFADLRTRIDEIAAARDARSRADAVAAAAGSQADAALRDDIAALAARVAALEQAERKADERIAQSMAAGSADRTVRLAVIAGALRAAVERGTPFAAELAAAKAAGADAAALARLDAFAAAGVPSAEALARDFDKLAPAMSSAAAPPAHDGGIIGRLQANAERLIHIRRVGEPAGDDPADVIARADAKAQRGDIVGALAELERLPPAVKAPAADWIKAAQARTAAIDAARQLAADALAALGKTSP